MIASREPRGLRRRWACLAVALANVVGCTYSVPGPVPLPMTPRLAPRQPRVEYSVARFSFAIGGGDWVTSFLDGRLLSKELMRSWEHRGYVADTEYVDDGTFSWTADYNLTMSGCQRNETTYMREGLSMLTLLLWPYPVIRTYDLQAVLQDVASGDEYAATVTGTDTLYVELLLLLAYPFAERGHMETMRRMGDHLYAELERQGAFSRMTPLPDEGWDGAPVPHTPVGGRLPHVDVEGQHLVAHRRR